MTEPTSITCQLVGAHFRPPAKALLAVLPAGHPLFLRPEPDNPYDANAVQVLLASASLIPLTSDPNFLDEMNNQLQGQGFDVDAICAQPEWHLGFLPRAAKGNQALEQWNIQVQCAIHEICLHANADDEVPHIPAEIVPCALTFDAAGKPAVLIPWPPLAIPAT